MPSVLQLHNVARRVPGGTTVFSWYFACKAPYFATISPAFEAARPNYAEVRIPKRRAVENHIGTVHAIAVNGLEAAMGVLAESTIPATKRWLPKGMEVTPRPRKGS